MTQAHMNILVVDEMAETLLATQAMQAWLADHGVQVLTAASGAQALELLRTHEVGLALLDLQMAGMDGYALAELMRASPHTRLVPIIFITAAAPDGQRSFRGHEAGAVDFLCKPVDAWVLRGKLQFFADLHRQRTELARRMADLERVARLNAVMIGALSHDIRTPLAALTLNAELVSRHAQPAMQQAGVRLKAATLILSRQVDHLVNLASLPTPGEAPQRMRGDLAALVAARLQALLPADGPQLPATLDLQADSVALFDPLMVAHAVDHLLLLALTHGGGQALQVEVDGNARRAVVLRLKLPAALDTAAQQHLFGAEMTAPGLPPTRVGPGLDPAERVARAHGGSVIGRSNAREGTLFEMMLPRDLP